MITLEEVKDRYLECKPKWDKELKCLVREKDPELTLNEALERVLAEVEQVPEVVGLIDFIKSSQRGITR